MKGFARIFFYHHESAGQLAKPPPHHLAQKDGVLRKIMGGRSEERCHSLVHPWRMDGWIRHRWDAINLFDFLPRCFYNCHRGVFAKPLWSKNYPFSPPHPYIMINCKAFMSSCFLPFCGQPTEVQAAADSLISQPKTKNNLSCPQKYM